MTSHLLSPGIISALGALFFLILEFPLSHFKFWITLFTWYLRVNFFYFFLVFFNLLKFVLLLFYLTDVCTRAKVLQLCPALHDPVDCSPPGSSIHGLSQARILE